MSQLTVIIDGNDYTDYVEELNLSINGLNADGSGRDVQTGKMLRVKIADKWKVEVKMLRLPASVMLSLRNALKKTTYQATAGDASGEFYTDTIPLGSSRWDKDNGRYYDGVAFSMTEV